MTRSKLTGNSFEVVERDLSPAAPTAATRVSLRAMRRAEKDVLMNVPSRIERGWHDR